MNTSDPEGHVLSGPWVVVCGYCNWTSLDIGIKFDKPSNLAVQLAMLNNGGTPRAIYSKNPSQEIEYTPHAAPDNDPDSKFHTLKSFLSSQFSRSSSSSNPLLSPFGGDYNYSSPSSLARIMTIYSGNLGPYSKKPATKPIPVRESSSPSEGLHIIDPASDAAAIQKLRTEGWAGTASVAQRAEQRHPPRFIDDIRPVAQILRTKRSKRCRTCRHILVKPEPKITSTRFRIRLVALNYIPTISLKPLQSTGQPAIDLNALPSLRATQFLFTLKNPMFDAVKITLATPSHTPGRHSHKVTILCPQFEIGANTDAWDEALSGGDAAVKRSSKLVASRSNANDPTASNSGESKVAEAGKVWEKGRNWTTVVVEVVCAGIGEDAETVEDGDVVEIPVFIRMEWEGEAAEGEKGGKEKRELAYWAVVGVGRVGRSKEKALD